MPRPSRDGGYGWPASQAGSDSRLSLLRELGEQAVLETIFRRGPITRPEIAIATSLSKPTVSAAVSRLEQEGLVRASGRRAGQRGRKPVAYVVSTRVGFVVGGDIGGSNVRVAAADLFGEPICDVKQPTTKDGSRAVGMQVLEMVSEVIDEASAVHGRPLALGISSPGIVDQTSGRVTSLAYNVAPEGGFDPVEVIRDRFDLPVLVENNVNLAAVGEKWFGLARGVSTMVFIAIGAGIGMGIVIDDELVRGAHGAAGEIGYLPLVGDPVQPPPPVAWWARGRDRRRWDRRGVQRAPRTRTIPSCRRSTTCSSSPTHGKRGSAVRRRPRRGAAGNGDRDGVRDSRSRARRTRRRDRLEPAAAAPGARRRGGAGSDHGAHRDEPARRAGRTAGGRRGRAERRPDLAALRRCSSGAGCSSSSTPRPFSSRRRDLGRAAFHS